MNASFPEIVDAWRMVQARRTFHGALALNMMPRLQDSLVTTEGEARYDLEFGKDELGVPFLQIHVTAALPLTCQRTLQAFMLPVRVDTRLGLITREADEAGLPTGYEPLLTPDGQLRLADVIEDELILAVPVVPVKPGTQSQDFVWGEAAVQSQEQDIASPFKVLEQLKASRK